jgi:hypothetical protein
MSSMIIYPENTNNGEPGRSDERKIFQINVLINEQQYDWLRIREIKTRFNFNSKIKLNIFRNNIEQKENLAIVNEAKNILDDNLNTGFRIEHLCDNKTLCESKKQNINSIGFISSVDLDGCNICVRTRGLQYKTTNSVVMGLDSYMKFEGQENQIHESSNFFCFKKELSNSFSLNIVENNNSKKPFEIVAIFFEGACMHNF